MRASTSRCPIAAPTDEELAASVPVALLANVPPRGGITIFDRSWYGRVLVERVEGYCCPSRLDARLRRDQPVRGAARPRAASSSCKFWLQISKDEQLRRFQAREKTPFKRFKITAGRLAQPQEVGRVRAGGRDMVDRTSTEIAPWTLVEAEDKYFARVKILKTIVQRLEAALD